MSQQSFFWGYFLRGVWKDPKTIYGHNCSRERIPEKSKNFGDFVALLNVNHSYQERVTIQHLFI